MRTHPGLPTPDEIRNGASFNSDHLPVYWRVNLEEPSIESHDVPTLNIISQNVLGHVSCSGLHTPDLYESENEEQQSQRYKKMAIGFSQAAQKLNVDVILLQEAPSDLLMPHLEACLGGEWAFKTTLATGVISCYRKTRLALEKVELDRKQRIHTLHLQDKKTNKTISVSNIWGIFSPVPFDGIEERFIDVLKKSPADIAILGGDTNSRIAPINATPQNITTTNVPCKIIPLQDEDWRGQLSDFPDGAFVRTQNGVIKQLDNLILDLDASEFITDDRAKAERNHYPKFRLVVHIDDEAKKQPLINNQTRDIYQTYLRNELNEKVYVQPAANDNNEKGVGISFQKRSQSYQFIRNQVLAAIPDAQIQNLSIDNADIPASFHTIVVPQTRTQKLHEIITDCVLLTKALRGITNYQNNPTNRLSIFSYLFFDSQRGKLRASIYKSALESPDYSFENKLIFLFSLLVSYDGKNLKNDMVDALGAPNLQTAQRMILNQIKDCSLKSTGSIKSTKEIYKHVAQIVKIANSPPKVLPKMPSTLLKVVFEEPAVNKQPQVS